MTTGIHRKPPRRIQQTRSFSCWAAVLESWSRADARIPTVTEEEMIAAYGQDQNGGITPLTKIPVIAARFGFKYDVFSGKELGEYLRKHLAHSHVFCAAQRGSTSHAVLIYRLSGQTLTGLTPDVSYMDPDGGCYRFNTLACFVERNMVVMRK